MIHYKSNGPEKEEDDYDHLILPSPSSMTLAIPFNTIMHQNLLFDLKQLKLISVNPIKIYDRCNFWVIIGQF